MYDYFSTWDLNNSDEYRYLKIELQKKSSYNPLIGLNYFMPMPYHLSCHNNLKLLNTEDAKKIAKMQVKLHATCQKIYILVEIPY